jgi:hypothetical protein
MRNTQAILSLDWKRAIGEVALIAIGIGIALYAESLYEDWSDRQEEKLLVSQMLEGLQQDLTDVESLVTYYEKKGAILMNLEQHLRDKKPYNEDLREGFGALKFFNWYTPSTGVYETLKSQGLDIISDTAVRLRIVRYYDGIAKGVLQRNDMSWEDIKEVIEPFYREHFRFGLEDRYYVEPIDYEEIVSKDQFLYILSQQILVNESFRVPIYRAAVEQTSELIAILEAHVDSL